MDHAACDRHSARPQIARVGPVQARRIADAFLAAPRVSSDRLVHAAYDDLANQAGRWFERLTGAAARAPIRVVYTRHPEPYATGSELAQRVRRERVLEVWPSRYDRDRTHPLLDDSVGGAFDRMRAVHDIVSHASCGYEFDRDGEYSAWRYEHQMYTGLARWALATELHAEHSVLWTTGSPAVHKAMLLPTRLLAASLNATVAEDGRAYRAAVMPDRWCAASARYAAHVGVSTGSESHTRMS